LAFGTLATYNTKKLLDFYKLVLYETCSNHGKRRISKTLYETFGQKHEAARLKYCSGEIAGIALIIVATKIKLFFLLAFFAIKDFCDLIVLLVTEIQLFSFFIFLGGFLAKGLALMLHITAGNSNARLDLGSDFSRAWLPCCKP